MYTLLGHSQSHYPLRVECPETFSTKPSIKTMKHLKTICVFYIMTVEFGEKLTFIHPSLIWSMEQPCRAHRACIKVSPADKVLAINDLPKDTQLASGRTRTCSPCFHIPIPDPSLGVHKLETSIKKS